MTRESRRPPHLPPHWPSDWRDDQASRLRGLTTNIALAGVAATAGIALAVAVNNHASATPLDTSVDQAAPTTSSNGGGTFTNPGTQVDPNTLTDPNANSNTDPNANSNTDPNAQQAAPPQVNVQTPTFGRHRHATSGGS